MSGGELEAGEPEVTEPEVTEPEVTEPEVTELKVTEPEVTVATAPTVSRTTSTTTTQPEARPEPASPPAEALVEAEVPPPVTSVEPDPIGWEDLEHLTVETDSSGAAPPLATVIDTKPIEDMPMPRPERPEVNIESDYELTVEVLPLAEVDPPAMTTEQAVTVPRPVTPDDDGDVVHLTFDDGPSPDYTPQILDVLARHDARATFFVVGSLAQAYPDIIQRIAAEGHTIANHAWNHEDLAGMSRAEFDETISRTQAVLGDLAAPCLRPPYGSIDAFTREWAASHGLTLITWDASPRDWLRPPAEEIADYIVKWARPGVVLLMHDGGGDRSRTVQGLDMALERLADRGLRYEPVCR